MTTGPAGAAARATDRARIANDAARAITLILAPSAVERLLVPGASVVVEAEGPAGPHAELLVERSCDTATVWAWPGASVRVVAPDGRVLVAASVPGAPGAPGAAGRGGAVKVPGLQPAGTLWTVGHSSRPLDEFLDLLAAHRVERVVDVRRHAGSRKHPHFHPEALAASLAGAGIGYGAIAALGGRRTPRPDSPHVAWRNPSFRGYADHMDGAEFADGARELAALARGERVAMMCAEAVWWRCHRSMIADCFKAHGWRVLHVLGPGEPREHPYTPVARVVAGELTY